MICGPEIRAAVATTLGLPTRPPARATWADPLYTCTYRLPQGPLVVSVQESPSKVAARRYFTDLRQRLQPTQPLSGIISLGLPAYTTSTGAVAFLKDNDTLLVDAGGLPARVGRQHRSRDDLAYTIATDILGCWTGK